MVMTGTIHRGLSKNEAFDQAGAHVICLECLEPTRLRVSDESFGDPFGGVIEWRVLTDCCESDNYRSEGCDSCGKMLALKPFGDCFYCESCYVKNEKEV